MIVNACDVSGLCSTVVEIAVRKADLPAVARNSLGGARTAVDLGWSFRGLGWRFSSDWRLMFGSRR